MTLSTISEKLAKLASQLEKGELHADEIMEMTELARQLHERMIVLQYKAFEDKIEPAKESSEPETVSAEQAETISDTEPAAYEESAETDESVDEFAEPEESIEATREIPAFRLSDTPATANQISLIDSIEEIKRMESSLNESFRDDNTSTLAQKLHKKPIANLKSAITINQKFSFISTLFESDKEAFDKAIAHLDGIGSYLEADNYIQNTLKDRYDWEMKSVPVQELLALVQRRYIL